MLVSSARHNRFGRPHVGVEIELLPQRDIHRPITAADWSREGTLETEPGPANGIECRIGKRSAGIVDSRHAAELLVPIERHAERIQRLQRRLRDLGPDAVTPDQRGFAATQGKPGVRFFTARVRAVQASSPSPRAVVRHPTLPIRVSISTTDNSARAFG